MRLSPTLCSLVLMMSVQIQMRHNECNVEDKKSLLLGGRQGILKRKKGTVVIRTITQLYILVRCPIISELSGSDSFPDTGFLSVIYRTI